MGILWATCCDGKALTARGEEFCDAMVAPLYVRAMQVLAQSNVHVNIRALEFSNGSYRNSGKIDRNHEIAGARLLLGHILPSARRI